MDERELIYTLLADMVGATDPKDVFYAKQITGGKSAGKYSCLLGGKKITKNQVGNLIAEVATFQSMSLYKVFMHTLRHEAELRMFKLAKTERDMDWGKSILHATGVMEEVMKSIRNVHLDEVA